jgi:hypothetical protein
MVTVAGPRTSQQSDAGLLIHVNIDYPFCKMNIQPPQPIPPPSSFRMDKHNTFLKKKRRGGVRVGVETETTMSTGEGPSSG